MRYLLDTNAVSGLLSRNEVSGRALRLQPGDIGLSSIVAYEAYYGAFKSSRVEWNLGALAKLPFELVPFDDQDARAAGRVRWQLQSLGTPIGPYDVLIAGQALARDLTLVTHNVREFSRVAGLRVEDWEASASP